MTQGYILRRRPVAVRTTVRSPVTADLLVNELAQGQPDTALENHPNVLWYGTIFDQMQLSPSVMREDWSISDNDYNPAQVGTDLEWPKISFQSDPTYGVDVMRFESCSVTPNTLRGGSQALSLNLCQMRKYLNSDTYGGNFRGSAVQTGPLNGIYGRFSIYLEQSFKDGFAEPNGFKFCGPETNAPANVSMVGWCAPPGERYDGGSLVPIGANQVELRLYMAGIDVTGSPGAFNSFALGAPIGQPYILCELQEWVTWEWFFRINDQGQANGVRKWWLTVPSAGLQNALVYSGENLTMHNAAGLVEINNYHAQLYHGGAAVAPATPMHVRTMGHVMATRRIGAPRPV